ncbi:hypothetical protein A3B18_01710 [Candidatus Giovannonibacteria bacterium RIFCSPLOWO2_01_FULL_46_13]|uniref:Uncharacterized protein n=1 Tax=Candidatus Giovannonibacteria bacterium RIFCSPLOWO2_01_FULL_46_13 TaxID=1798352 RepID=A0A1F5X5E9_9BACT|nr:MAG: hypothetical protein A3B18_01710 [Candidatus Giovannonibacteria bacterium RIFCSPLOWO2_01_FULL_46_13]
MEIVQNGEGKTARIKTRKWADMHHHFREGKMLKLIAPMVRKRFAIAVAMPNLPEPTTTSGAMTEYRERILSETREDEGGNTNFQCLSTLYLTDTMDLGEVVKSMSLGAVGVKYYPPGLTTNSESGVQNPASMWTRGTIPYLVLSFLSTSGKVLLLHAADGFDEKKNEIDPFDQEKHFIRKTLPRIIDAHSDLKISVEHLSSRAGVDFLRKHGGSRLGCSITPQHLLCDRRDLFRGGFRPHNFWWPIFGREEDRDALREFVKEGRGYVYAGTDSAPHPISEKEKDGCKGGVMVAHAAVEFYLEAFEKMDALDERLENFGCINGPRFYGLEPSKEEITFERRKRVLPTRFTFNKEGSEIVIRPFRAGEKINWQLV